MTSQEREALRSYTSGYRAALTAREERQRRFSDREVEAMLEAAHTNAHEPESDDELPLTIDAAVKWAEDLLGEPVGGSREDTERPDDKLKIALMERDWLLGAWAAMAGIPQANAEAVMLVWTKKWRETALRDTEQEQDIQ